MNTSTHPIATVSIATTNDAPVANGAEKMLADVLCGAVLLNKAQLGARIGITVRGVEEMMAKRRIPSIRIGHKTTRFSWPKVEAALAKLTAREI